MAKKTLTHIENFSQEFFHPILILKELMIWKSALRKCVYQILRVIFVTSDEGLAREGLDHDQG